MDELDEHVHDNNGEVNLVVHEANYRITPQESTHFNMTKAITNSKLIIKKSELQQLNQTIYDVGCGIIPLLPFVKNNAVIKNMENFVN